MTAFKDIKFTGADMIKLAGFLMVTGGMWSDLKADKVETKSKQDFLQYQINELKKCCGLAVLPKETKIETE